MRARSPEWAWGVALLLLCASCATSGQSTRGGTRVICTAQDEAYFAARIAELSATRTSSATDAGAQSPAPRSRQVIGAVIRDKLSDMLRCYEAWASQSSGELRVTFAIEPGGQVSRACVSRSSFGTDAVPGCVLEVMSHLRFAVAGEQTIVTYPLRFN